MSWPEAILELVTLVVGLAAVVLIFNGWPVRRRRDDDN